MNNPNFAGTPDVQGAAVNTANTSVTGASGTVATIFTAAANGSRIDFVQIKGIVAEGTQQAADTVRFFVQIAGTGTIFAIKEAAIPAGGGNVGTTYTNAEVIVPLGINLPANSILFATTHTGGSTASYHVTAWGADF
jgi:hypothetical protein